MDVPSTLSPTPLGSDTDDFRRRLDDYVMSAVLADVNKPTNSGPIRGLSTSSKTTTNRKQRAATISGPPPAINLLFDNRPSVSKNLRTSSRDNVFEWRRKLELAKHRRSSSCDDPTEQVSSFDASNVCFDEVFAELQRFKEENGNLTIHTSHPTFDNILDNLLAFGMGDLLRNRWDSQFAGLKVFKRQQNDCLVPPSHPTLGIWTRVQFDHYELFRQRLPSPLTKQRFDYLNDIGFDEFVRWEEANRAGDTEEVVDMNIVSGNLTIDEKIALKRMNTNANTERCDTLPGREEVAAEMAKKQTRRHVWARSGCAFSETLITQNHLDENAVKDGTTNEVDEYVTSEESHRGSGRFSPMRRSSSVSNVYTRNCDQPASPSFGVAWRENSSTVDELAVDMFNTSWRDLSEDPRSAVQQSSDQPASPSRGVASRENSNTLDDFAIDNYNISWRDLTGPIRSALSQSITDQSDNEAEGEMTARRTQKQGQKIVTKSDFGDKTFYSYQSSDQPASPSCGVASRENSSTLNDLDVDTFNTSWRDLHSENPRSAVCQSSDQPASPSCGVASRENSSTPNDLAIDNYNISWRDLGGPLRLAVSRSITEMKDDDIGKKRTARRTQKGGQRRATMDDIISDDEDGEKTQMRRSVI